MSPPDRLWYLIGLNIETIDVSFIFPHQSIDLQICEEQG